MLLIDAGNSRIKWAWADGPTWLRQGALALSDTAILQQQLAALPTPDKIMASNVAGDHTAQLIVDACSAWGMEVKFIAARQEQCGVRNSYEQPSQLGSDRWAALIAAWQQARDACLVVHCGTATTVDALSNEGEFLGGLILPGLDLMQSSLARATAGLPAGHGEWAAFPRNTADAMASGAIQATCGAIQQQYARLGTAGAYCLLSGGAARVVEPHLELPVEIVDNLVLRGLQIIGSGDE